MTAPFLTLLTVALLCASALAAVFLLRRAPRAESELLQLLERERAGLRMEFAKALEDAAGIGESISRHRARVDGARGGRPTNAPPERTLSDLSGAEAAKLPPTQQLAWAAQRIGQRR